MFPRSYEWHNQRIPSLYRWSPLQTNNNTNNIRNNTALSSTFAHNHPTEVSPSKPHQAINLSVAHLPLSKPEDCKSQTHVWKKGWMRKQWITFYGTTDIGDLLFLIPLSLPLELLRAVAPHTNTQFTFFLRLYFPNKVCIFICLLLVPLLAIALRAVCTVFGFRHNILRISGKTRNVWILRQPSSTQDKTTYLWQSKISSLYTQCLVLLGDPKKRSFSNQQQSQFEFEQTGRTSARRRPFSISECMYVWCNMQQ